jgi:uncharacterized membrane-anchored protein YitT (DUF2179 family)
MLSALELLQMIAFFARSIGAIFVSLDSIYVIEDFSLLDIFIAVILLDIIFSAIENLILKQITSQKEEEYENRYESDLASRDESDDKI